MNGLNGIIISGKVYEATEGKEDSCLKCDLIDDSNDDLFDDAGNCVCSDFCLAQGRCNVFRFSQELTDKLNVQ